MGFLAISILELLPKLQIENYLARKVRSKKGREKDLEEAQKCVLIHQGLPYLPEIIRTKVISSHYDDPWADHFEIKKTQELIAFVASVGCLRHGTLDHLSWMFSLYRSFVFSAM